MTINIRITVVTGNGNLLNEYENFLGWWECFIPWLRHWIHMHVFVKKHHLYSAYMNSKLCKFTYPFKNVPDALLLEKYKPYKVLKWLKFRFIAVSCHCIISSMSIGKHHLFSTSPILLISRKYIPIVGYITPAAQTTTQLSTECILLCFHFQIYSWFPFQPNAFWTFTMFIFTWFPDCGKPSRCPLRVAYPTKCLISPN